MVDIVDLAAVRRASVKDAAAARVRATSARPQSLTPLTEIDAEAWRTLATRAAEPNGYYLPDWELAVNASVPGRTGASALAAWHDKMLVGLLPVVSMRQAYKIPLPALVSAHPYGTLCSPPLDHGMAVDAAATLMQAARQSGARALVLREVALDGAAMKAFNMVLRGEGLRRRVLQWHLRASLDATRDADELLGDALGAKKLKELRRQRHRLAEHGAVTFEVARSPQDVAAALESFLTLEASGWKGARGTALAQVEGDATFIRRATSALAATGNCEIVTLARRRDAGGVGHRAAASEPRVLLQARRRRALRKVLTRRAAHAGSDTASLRGSGDRLGRFHRESGSSHDQSDLARPLCDRRRADPADDARSGRADDPCGAGRAQSGARGRAQRASSHPEALV